MSKVKKFKKFRKKGKLNWQIFSSISLFTRLATTIALLSIAFSLQPVKQKAKLFNNCVIEASKSSNTTSKAVQLCNGKS